MYRTFHVIRHVMPDDRLVNARIVDDELLLFEYKAWHINPALVSSMGSLSSAVAESGVFDLDPVNALGEPVCGAWFELARPELTGGLPMIHRCSPGPPCFFEMRVRSDMVDPALVREVNEQILPVVCSALIPALSL